jgi:hypothetical protein
MGLNRGVVVLLVAAGLYCYASGAEVLLVKVMNSDAVSVLLPLGTALLLNGYWPLQLILYGLVYRSTANPRPLTLKLVRGYAIIGFVAGAVSGLRCIGINYMPGSVYVIISTADLPINTLMSRFALGKKFEPLQCAPAPPHPCAWLAACLHARSTVACAPGPPAAAGQPSPAICGPRPQRLSIAGVYVRGLGVAVQVRRGVRCDGRDSRVFEPEPGRQNTRVRWRLVPGRLGTVYPRVAVLRLLLGFQLGAGRVSAE